MAAGFHDLQHHEAAFVAARLDAIGDKHAHELLDSARIPDGRSIACEPLHIHGKCVIGPFVGTLGEEENHLFGTIGLKLNKLYSDYTSGLTGCYADDTDTSFVGDLVETFTNEQQAIPATECSYYRVVGATIKVWPVSSKEVTTGLCTAGNCHLTLHGATYGSITALDDYCAARSLPLDKGITVAYRPTAYYGETDPWYSYGTVGAHSFDLMQGPWVVVRGLTANVRLYVEWVLRVEVTAPIGSSLRNMRVTEYSSRFQFLEWATNNPDLYPSVVSGHSFTGTLRKVSGSMWRVIDPVLQAAFDRVAEALLQSVPGLSVALKAAGGASKVVKTVAGAAGPSKKRKKRKARAKPAGQPAGK